VLDNGFVNLDDDLYVYANPVVGEGVTPAGIRWALTDRQTGNWHPLTWLSHMADVSLFGLDPGKHHGVSLLLHLGSVALFWRLLHASTGRLLPSLAAALLFGVHPLRVESVAWASERKDVLALFFGMATLLLWVGHARRPGLLRWGAAMATALLALLAKPLAVAVPLLLLLLDWWPLGRWRSAGDLPALAVEKIPLLLATAGVSLATLEAQAHVGAIGLGGRGHLAAKAAYALAALGTYLGETVFPRGLAVYHPLDPLPPWGAAAWGGAAAVLVTLLALRFRREAPALAAGWAWFLVALAPVSGLVKAGAQAHADRYTYLPHAGLLLAVAWTAADLTARRSRWRTAVAAVAAVAVFLLLARRQTILWRDSVSLFSHTVALTGPNWLARINLAEALLERDDPQGALPHYREAAALRPEDGGTRHKLAATLSALGRGEEAILQYREAVRLDPLDADALVNLGILLAGRGRLEEAVESYRRALAIRPDHALGHYNLGTDLTALGRLDEAEAHFRGALALWPGFPEAARGLERVVALRRARREAPR
jgi:tetratricopeptide (TPR) repeat protein